MISFETLDRVIQLVREHHSADRSSHTEQMTLPRSYATQSTSDQDIDRWTEALLEDEVAQAVEGDRKEQQQYEQLLAYIGRLDLEDRRDLLALCWLGRADFDTFAQARQHARTIPADNITGYLADKYPLDEYLARGLARFRERQREQWEQG